MKQFEQEEEARKQQSIQRAKVSQEQLLREIAEK